MNRTDAAWEQWGARDPYYGVLTDERFRASRITDADREEFFQHGFRHVDAMLRSCRTYIDAAFMPQSVLDFGCGVGRVLVPFAHLFPRVVGLDVSPSMLSEARRNCDQRGAGQVDLVLSDDALGGLCEQFDLVHSTMVLQHVEVDRGRALFARLLERVRPGGIAALHVTYGKSSFADRWGQPPATSNPMPNPAAPTSDAAVASASLRSRAISALRDRLRALDIRRLAAPAPPPAAPADETPDPEMRMHSYHLGEIAYLMQRAGAQRFHAEFSDHGGELGVMLYLGIPRPDAAVDQT
jgi:SAM-dependent methyltransferase